MADPHVSSLPDQLQSQMTYEAPHEGVEGDQNGRHDCLSPNLDGPRAVSPIKPRPWSSQGIRSVLSPSPTLIENRRGSKDDSHLCPLPTTPKRPAYPARGLSLQMPPQDLSSTSTANLSKQIPVSPKPECPTAYPSPTSVLPRRSRGLDYSRAATNLHHSTLAEQSSPESSPTVGVRRGVNIPGRKPFVSSSEALHVPELPRNMATSLWTAIPITEKGGFSSSVGSSAMMENDSGSSSSDDTMDMDDDDDTIHMTPQNTNSLANPFNTMSANYGKDDTGAWAPGAAKLMSYQRNRLLSRRNRTRGSSSSASGQSNLQSPVPPSPPLVRSIDSGLSINGGFLLDENAKREIVSRRESLSLGTNDLQLSDAEQSAGEANPLIMLHDEVPISAPVTPSMEERKQVVRKAVTRRSNLLPKSKGFARIKAALLEEGAPVDTDLRREAEVVRQVRESDTDGDLGLQPSQSTTRASSPNLGPVTAGPPDTSEGFQGELSTSSEESTMRRSSNAFTSQAVKQSGGVSFWNSFDERMRTPPPPMVPRDSSSGLSDDVNMTNGQSSTRCTTPQQNGIYRTLSHDSASSTPHAMNTTTFEVPKKGNKRMRDDDFDVNFFKRRAVSPGLSVQNSPVLPQSPGWWGAPKREERVSSNGSAGSGTGTGKRVGMQGMNDTNDSLMNMSIE